MRIYLIGTGMGNNPTAEAKSAIAEADVFIGSARMLEIVKDCGKPTYTEYDAERIRAYIESTPNTKLRRCCFRATYRFTATRSGFRKHLPSMS